MNTISVGLAFGLLGIAVIAPVATENLKKMSSKTADEVSMLANDDFSSITVMFGSSGGSSPPECPADLNGNGSVEGADLGFMLAGWGPCQTQTGCVADLNFDAIVNGGDLTILLAGWGPCPN